MSEDKSIWTWFAKGAMITAIFWGAAAGFYLFFSVIFGGGS